MTIKLFCSFDKNENSSIEHLKRYGLLDSPPQAYAKHTLNLKLKETPKQKASAQLSAKNKLALAQTPEEAYEIFNSRDIQKQSSGLPIMTYAVMENFPELANMLLKENMPIDYIDKIRLNAMNDIESQRTHSKKANL